MSACRFIVSNSAGVSFPGLFKMCSGIASFPMSCRRAAVAMACSFRSSATPSRFASSSAYTWTRRMWPWVI